ncbi:MAG: dephospho-CoA kinase [Phycisphaerales bacterium]
MPPAPMHAPRSPLPIIGIVGGIGAGKSQVARALEQEGCVVSYSDQLAADALRDPAVQTTLRSWWGDSIFTIPAGAPPGTQPQPDRSRIAAIVFAHPAQRARLEGLIHPWIARVRQRQFAQAPPGTLALVIDAPLLIEAGLHRECTAVIYVDAPQSTRQARVQATRGWGPEELSRREAAQMPLDLKRTFAHHVLRNDGGSDALRAQVRQVLGAVLAAHAAGHR